MSKKILVTGVLGQDGANMCEYLLGDSNNNKVFGMIRRVSNPNFVNCKNFLDHHNFQLVYGDLVDEYSLSKLVQDIQPDYFINFAANSFVGCSWDMPMQVFDTNSVGVMRCLEAIRAYKPNCRFYSAGSSEEFGDVDYSPQDMKHPLKPRSPYGASKCAARHLVKVYRESYDMYAVHGILFNHEGTKRGEEFVTRKITKGVARIKKELSGDINTEAPTPIKLGNIYSRRDWSDSEDFVKGIWLMINQEHPKDYLLASGETHTIKEFIELAFKAADIDGYWHGEGLDETFIYKGDTHGHSLVAINEKFYRPAEVELLLGDPTEAKEELGWKPEIMFDKLVERMVKFDLDAIQEK